MLIFKAFSIFSKISFYFFKFLNLGHGTTLISKYFLKLFPNEVDLKDFKFSKGVIFITGTNGKTTTSKITADILKKLGFKVLHNHTGGNILRSVVRFFLLSYSFFGSNKYDFLVLEVDEGSVSEISKLIKPTTIVLLNFSRDQLDRYFEIENITHKISEFLQNNPRINIIFNLNDDYCLSIVESVSNKSFAFEKNLDLLKHSNFTEEYMSENLDALAKILLTHQIRQDIFIPALKILKKPFGRGETITYKKIKFDLNLVKNPSSFNRALFELNKLEHVSNVLLILNDDEPDGTDISWIYDIDGEILNQTLSKKNLYFSGKRAYEMATRVKYALNSFNLISIDRNLKEAVKEISKSNLQDVYILSNYSAMLSLRQILLGRKIQ